jgi:hypothetical protein
LYVKNSESIKHCKKIVIELERVKEAALDLIDEFERADKQGWKVYQSQNRGLLQHRIIDLKHTLTKLARLI